MIFENLKSSIDLNAHESPSIINALCMVRSLFEDMKQEAGVPLSQCPIGDGQLQQELIRVSKHLLSIYEENSDALQRNRARLESIMEELREAQTELEKIADAAILLPEKEAEYRKLQQQLETAKAAQAAYAALLSEIEAAQKELAQLRRFDMDAARKQLADLQEQIRGLEEQIRTLDTQIQTKKEEKSALADDIAARQGELVRLQQELPPMTLKKQSLLDEKLRILTEISSLTAETNGLNTELETLRASLALRKQERDNARKQVEDYRRDVLDPVVKERDALLETEKQLLAEKEAAEKQSTALKTNQRKLIQEIGAMKGQYDKDHEAYQKDTARKEELIRLQKALTEKLNAATDALADQQRAYDKLEKEDLPTAEQHLTEETQRLEKLQAKITDTKNECQEKTTKIDELNRELPAKQEKLRNLRSLYEALTASYNSNNKDILDLEREVQDLKEKNNQERLARHQARLQDQKQELLDLEEQFTAVDSQIQKHDAEIETKNKDLQTLSDLKKKKEEGAEGISRLLTELKPYDTEEFRRQAHSIALQYENLLTIRSSLAQSISHASKCITGYELTAEELQVQKLESLLTQARKHSHGLYRSLVQCAEAVVKNHITEEPK